MKKQNPQDERIMSQRQKINSEVHGILMIALFGAIIIQDFLLKAPFEQYAAEFICFVGIAVYLIIRYMALGVNIYGEGKNHKAMLLINSIVAGLAVTAINGVLNYLQYAEQYREDGMGYFIAMLAITFISATVFTFMVLACIYYFNYKKQVKIIRQLEEAEQDE